MAKDWPIKRISLNKILLDTDNIRLDLGGKITQELLIADLFNNEQAMEMVTSIVKNGVFPDEQPDVIKQGSKYVVVEGNRRVAALKAIQKPSCAPKIFAEKISKLKPLPRIPSINVVVAPSRQAVQKLIASKHTKNTRRAWKPLRQAYFYKTLLDSKKEKWTIQKLQEEFAVHDISKFIRMLEMHKIAKSLEYRTDEIAAKVHDERSFSITTLERVYNNQKVQAALGLEFKPDGRLTITANQKQFSGIYQRIVQDIAMGNEDSRSLNKDDKIEVYLNSIIEKPVRKTKKPITTKSFHEKPAPNKGATKARSARKPKGLIPSYVSFRLNCGSLRFVFDELRRIPVEAFPNAAHDLMRSFLECSLVEYLKQRNLYNKVRKHSKHNPTLGEMLAFLEKSNEIEDETVKQIARKVKADWHKDYSLERLNMVNHSEGYSSDEKTVRNAWANIEKLMIFILNPKEESK